MLLSPALEIIIIIAVALICLVAVAGNLAVLVVLRANERRTKRKVSSNIFIRNLAITDLLIGLLILPTMLTNMTYGRVWKMHIGICQIYGAMVTTLTSVSILSLTGIAIDRYVAVVWPIKYREIISRKRANLMIAFCWFQSLVLGVLPFVFRMRYEYMSDTNLCQASQHNNSELVYLAVTSFYSILIPFVILTWCYIRIYTEFKVNQVRRVQSQLFNRAKRLSIQVIEWGHNQINHDCLAKPEHHLETLEECSERDSNDGSGDVVVNMHALHTTFSRVGMASSPSTDSIRDYPSYRETTTSTFDNISTATTKSFVELKSIFKNLTNRKPKHTGTPKCMRNASLTARLIIVCFLSCWFPYIFYVVHIIATTAHMNNLIVIYLHTFVFIVALSNSAWNPLIYLSRSATYRGEIARMLLHKVKRKAPEHAVSMNIQRRLSTIAGVEIEQFQQPIIRTPLPAPKSQGSHKVSLAAFRRTTSHTDVFENPKILPPPPGPPNRILKRAKTLNSIQE